MSRALSTFKYLLHNRKLHLTLLVLGHALLLMAAAIHYACAIHHDFAPAAADSPHPPTALPDVEVVHTSVESPITNEDSAVSKASRMLDRPPMPVAFEQRAAVTPDAPPQVESARPSVGLLFLVAVLLDLAGYTLLSIESIGELTVRGKEDEMVHDVFRRLHALDHEEFTDLCRLLDDGCPNTDPPPSELL